MLGAAGDLAHHDLSLEGPEDDQAEFNWSVSKSYSKSSLELPTINVDEAGSMADQTVRGFEEVVEADA